MNSLLTFAQLQNHDQGWLTSRLLSVTLSSAEWVLWLLLILSVASVGVIIERIVYFSSHSLKNSAELAVRLARGELDAVKAAIQTQAGMEASVVREGIAAASAGPGVVEEIIAAAIARERPRYERFLSFLGTLGSNAPFVGLFGTVLGIIKAFSDLGQSGAKGAAVQQTVMSGISDALVATAVGLFVAIPAVVGYNLLTRSLKTITSRTNVLGHALVGHLKASGSK